MALSSSQILDDDILFELDRFKIGSIKKRIVNELVEFKKKDAYIHVEFQENKHNHSHAIQINVVPNNEDNVYCFTITSDYPFKPPSKVTINFKDYKKYLKIDSSKTMEDLRKYNGIQCLCCNTISCSANWSPAIRLQDFISEFKQIKKYRRDIINRLLSIKIIDKYLISDINLLEWLV
jgi:ubiquitin-protein ligase